MTNEPSDRFDTHDLGDGSLFLVGRLAAGLTLDACDFQSLWDLHPSEKHVIMMHGRPVETPRWQQAYGANYHYTGRVNQALPMLPLLFPLREWVQKMIDLRLNGILLSWYSGSAHYIGPHHDSIKGMVRDTPIVTVSFGETRVFRLTKLHGNETWTRNVPAPNGTVFVMPFDTNLAWKLGVPKSTRYTGKRISVTFRAFEQ